MQVRAQPNSATRSTKPQTGLPPILKRSRIGPSWPKSRPVRLPRPYPTLPPQHGESLETILQDIDRLILPGITHWNHPAFFAYFGISGSGPGIVGELISAALNVNAMLWRTSPAATELEQRTLSWVAQMLGLPSRWFGEITDTASASSLYALAAAREAAGLDIRDRGMAGRTDLPPLAVYGSTQTHSSIDKAAIALGIGRQWTRQIETDAEFRLRPDRLEGAIRADLAAGVKPLAVVATVGTTSSTSIDPVPAIADICERYGVWLHVDAAYGGAAAVVPSHRSVLAGCERADSFVTNPHKWLLTPIDCSLLYTRRPDDLKRAFSLVAEYLRTDESEVINLMDYGLSLGRRFRAPQAMDGHPRLWTPGLGPNHRGSYPVRPVAGRPDRRRTGLAALSTSPLFDGVFLSSRGWGNRPRGAQRGHHRRREHQRQSVFIPHQAERSVRHPGRHRQLQHRPSPRRTAVGAAAPGRGRMRRWTAHDRRRQ